jgi:serine protease inhibitor ecotin
MKQKWRLLIVNDVIRPGDKWWNTLDRKWYPTTKDSWGTIILSSELKVMRRVDSTSNPMSCALCAPVHKAHQKLIRAMLKTLNDLGSDSMARIDSRLWHLHYAKKAKRLHVI